MTYKKFKDEVKKLGLDYYILDTIIGIKNSKSIAICYVDTKKMFCAYQKAEFYSLDESLQKKVFELVTELAKTPLDKRGEIK